MSIFPRCARGALHTLTDLPSVAFSLILHTYAMWYRQVIVLCFVFFSLSLALAPTRESGVFYLLEF